MAKFLFSRLIIFLIPALTVAQEYAVFSVTGSPKVTVAGTTSSLTKGAVFKGGEISISNSESVSMLNNAGELYQIETPGSYGLQQIEQYKADASKEGFSKKYFTYVWKQISGKDQAKTHTGNIYRDAVLDILIAPRDSVSIYSNKVVFAWEPTKQMKNSYFFLKNDSDESITKFKVEGDSLTLFVGSVFLKRGSEYSWGVAGDEYPNFTLIKMNKLYFLDSETYKATKEEMSELQAELLALGFSEKEIESQLCEYYNFCE